MRLLIMGPPGSGKGTQGKIIADALHIPHISTGDIFRETLNQDTEESREIKALITRGQLVPDSLTNTIVFKRLAEADCQEGYILDGFPRTVAQAEALDDYLSQKGESLDSVIILDVDSSIILNRILNRRLCKGCGSSYNTSTNPPKVEDVCDNCGGSLTKRDDDTEETIIDRIEVYEVNTKPIIQHYDAKGITCVIEGDFTVREATEEIGKCLGRDI